MARYRYDGPYDVFHKSPEDTEGTKRGAIGDFPKSMVDHYTTDPKVGVHRFTPESDLKPAALKEAETVKASTAPVTVEERNVIGAKSGQ